MATSTVPTRDGPITANPRGFVRFAWTVLAWNLLVVLWGAYVRASGSGAGCGSHWPLCNGEVLPRAPQTATLIEFTHRAMSGIALVLVVALCVWAFRRFPSAHWVRRAAALSLFLIVTEALLGAGLVLFEYVARNESAGRALYLSAHLVNTQFLLLALAMTAFFASPETAAPMRPGQPRVLATLPVALVVSVSGAVAALGDTLFPAASLAAGFRQEFSATSDALVRLRILHPAFAIVAAAYIAFTAILAARQPQLRSAAFAATLLAIAQLCAGALNVVMLAPVWMQIVHLLLADLLWIALVLLCLRSLNRPEP